MIRVMYAFLRVGGTQPLAIEMLININTYGEMSAEQSFMSQVGHGSKSDCCIGASVRSFLTSSMVRVVPQIHLCVCVVTVTLADRHCARKMLVNNNNKSGEILRW